MPLPAYRIVTPRLVLRCWNPADAAPLAEAVAESMDELRPFIPWAQFEPQTVEERVQRLRQFRGAFDTDADYTYGVFPPDESYVLGGTGLHPRVGPDALEIGYWIRTSQTGQGYAAELSAALTRVAFEVHGVRRVHIHVDPTNVRSLSIPEKLGFTHEGTLRSRAIVNGAPRDLSVWTLLPHEYAGSLPSRTELQAYDAAGARLI